MISADVNADLTDTASWTRTNNVDKGSVLEGNPILGPDGKIWDVLRYNDSRTKAWVTKLDPADPSKLVDSGEIDFPYGTQFSKFYLLWDAQSHRYLMVGNAETGSTGAITQRNNLDLYESNDLSSWRHVRTLVEDDSPGSWDDSVRLRAFSQPTAQIDGNDLLVVSRTAYDGAENYHNTNRAEFSPPPGLSALPQSGRRAGALQLRRPRASRCRRVDVSDTDVDLTPGTEIVPGKVGDAIGISPSGDLPFDGAIDEVRIFGVAADQAMARSLAGLDGAPALAGLWVNGRPVAGLNPSVHHYDVVVPRGHLALVVAHASPGARVELPFRVSWLSDVESKPLTFTVRRGKLSPDPPLFVVALGDWG